MESINKHKSPGFTLTELMVGVAISAMVAVAIILPTMSSHPAELSSGKTLINSQFTYAIGLARMTGNGATMYIHGNTITVYPGRPNTTPLGDRYGTLWKDNVGTASGTTPGAWQSTGVFVSKTITLPVNFPMFDYNTTPTLNITSSHITLYFDSNGNITFDNTIPSGSNLLATQPLCYSPYALTYIQEGKTSLYWPTYRHSVEAQQGHIACNDATPITYPYPPMQYSMNQPSS